MVFGNKTVATIGFLLGFLLGQISLFGVLVVHRGTVGMVQDPKADSAEVALIFTGSSGRVGRGMDLLESGRVGGIFISGIGGQASLEELLMSKPTNWMAVHGDKIYLDHESQNTIQNVREAVRWQRRRGGERAFLITETLHMPRALYTARRCAADLSFIPLSVAVPGWWRGWRVVIGEYFKFLYTIPFGEDCHAP